MLALPEDDLPTLGVGHVHGAPTRVVQHERLGNASLSAVRGQERLEDVPRVGLWDDLVNLRVNDERGCDGALSVS